MCQVFAFVKSDQSNSSAHRADCHVCESLLEFRTKVEVCKSDVSLSIWYWISSLMNWYGYGNGHCNEEN